MIYRIPPHRRGDTWDGINSITISVNGAPVNLSNAKVKIEFRQSVDYPVVLTLSTDDNSIQFINAAAGVIRIPEKLIEVPFGTYLYDLQVTFPNGTVKTFMTGTWEITADITE